MKYFDKKNKRLVEIEKSANADFWDNHWDSERFGEYIKKSKDNQHIIKILEKYIPDKKGKILEGGCGRSQIVYCMYSNGYDAVGVDFARKTVKRVNDAIPEIDVQIGDVRNLHFKDNYFQAYWSLGVIEHFQEGYDDIFKEMSRVIKKDGYLFLSFPFMSPLRKFKSKINLYNEFDGDYADFYQFDLDANKVTEDIEQYGFKLIKEEPIDGIKGFKDEIKTFNIILQKLYDNNTQNILMVGFKFAISKFLATFAAHMKLLIYKKIGP